MTTTSPKAIGVGDHLPHLALPALDGASVNFEVFHGKRLVLFCWASW